MASHNPLGHGSYDDSLFQQSQEYQSPPRREEVPRFMRFEGVLYRQDLDPDEWHSLRQTFIVENSKSNATEYVIRTNIWRPRLHQWSTTVEAEQVVRMPSVLLQNLVWDKTFQEYVRPEAVRLGPNNEVLELGVWRTASTLLPGQWRDPHISRSADVEKLLDNRERDESPQSAFSVYEDTPDNESAFENHPPTSHSPASWEQRSNSAAYSTSTRPEQTRDAHEDFRSTVFEDEPDGPHFVLHASPSLENLVHMNQGTGLLNNPTSGESQPLGLTDMIHWGALEADDHPSSVVPTSGNQAFATSPSSTGAYPQYEPSLAQRLARGYSFQSPSPSLPSSPHDNVPSATSAGTFQPRVFIGSGPSNLTHVPRGFHPAGISARRSEGTVSSLSGSTAVNTSSTVSGEEEDPYYVH